MHYGVYADKCCLSTGYFGTLVKTETGRTGKTPAQEGQSPFIT